jgi:hypothetical protein
MESQPLMSRVLGWTRLSGWAIGLGLATSWLVRQTDRLDSGALVAVACLILMWRIIATIGLPELTRHTPGHQRNVQRSPLGKESLKL